MAYLIDTSGFRGRLRAVVVRGVQGVRLWLAAQRAKSSSARPQAKPGGVGDNTSNASLRSRVMAELGLFHIVTIMTFLSALLSVFFSLLLSFVIPFADSPLYLLQAFLVPFMVTPTLGFLAALGMRDLQRARRKASDLAKQDMLTGLGNRRAFFDTARRAEDAGAGHTTRAVLYIDIDHFKSINDRHGHDAGDMVLKHFAGLLRECTRSDDFVARIGGEEFAVHVVGVEATALAAIAQGLLARVRASAVDVDGTSIRYTASVGGAIGDISLSIDGLLALADKQLYGVKNGGRDGYRAVDARTLPTDYSPEAMQLEAYHIRRVG